MRVWGGQWWGRVRAIAWRDIVWPLSAQSLTPLALLHPPPRSPTVTHLAISSMCWMYSSFSASGLVSS